MRSAVSDVRDVFAVRREGEVIMQEIRYDGNGHPKPIKHGAKQYKRGPGLTGRARLEKRVHGLLMAASRLHEKEQMSHDGQWAEKLVAALMRFNVEARVVKGLVAGQVVEL